VRILYFSGDYTPHDYRFLEALAARGEDVGALFLKESTPAREERPLPEGVRTLAWPGGAREFTDENIPRLVEDLKLIAGDVWPDVIHAGPVQKPAYLAARAGLQPLVAVSWGSDMLVEANSSAWMQEATHFTLDHSAALVGDCEAVASAVKSFGFPEERIVTFPWGVDLDQYTPERVGNLRSQLGWEDCFVLISTRSWEPLLGVDVLAAGFAKAARRQTDLRLLILSG